MEKSKVLKKEIVFVLVAILAYAVSIYAINRENWLYGLILLVPSAVISVLSVRMFNDGKPTVLSSKENICILIWAGIYILLSVITMMDIFPFVNEISNWLWLVIIPFCIVKMTNHITLKEAFARIGLKNKTPKGWKKKLLFLCAIYLPFLVIFAKIEYQITMEMLQEKWFMLLFFPLVLLAMVAMAGTTEEIFFRGMLQRNLYNATKSQIIAVVVASFIFALYHLPFAYYTWPNTQGSLWLSIAGILAEQFVAAIFLGIAYIRTNNLWVPIILHSLTNAAWVTASLLTSESMIKFG